LVLVFQVATNESSVVIDKMATHWETQDFILHLYQGGFFHILELILFKLTLKAVTTCQKVSPGNKIISCTSEVHKQTDCNFKG
jgi:hypothetical protein